MRMKVEHVWEKEGWCYRSVDQRRFERIILLLLLPKWTFMTREESWIEVRVTQERERTSTFHVRIARDRKEIRLPSSLTIYLSLTHT